jgi:uncharacterized protein DUF4276
MTRLLVHVEGQTEESFVNEILQGHLVNRGFESVSARIMGNARLRRRRGGIRPWPPVRKDIINHLQQDPGCIATTMVDFYGLPQQGTGAWPGRAEAAGLEPRRKASHVEKALLANLAQKVGAGFDPARFVPFVVTYEFEGLLFSDCAAFSQGIGRPDLEPDLKRIRNGFETPEDIDDSPVTAPSKRVEGLVAGYEKPLLGTLAVLEIGLARIRAECPHFDGWVCQLESLVPEGQKRHRHGSWT